MASARKVLSFMVALKACRMILTRSAGARRHYIKRSEAPRALKFCCAAGSWNLPSPGLDAAVDWLRTEKNKSHPPRYASSSLISDPLRGASRVNVEFRVRLFGPYGAQDGCDRLAAGPSSQSFRARFPGRNSDRSCLRNHARGQRRPAADRQSGLAKGLAGAMDIHVSAAPDAEVWR